VISSLPGAAAANDDPVALLDAFSQAVIRVAERVAPAVVHVRRGAGAGSGVVIAGDGFVLTNAHVVDDAKSVEIVFLDGSTSRAPVIGTDAATDLAVIRALGPTPSSLELAAADTLRVGQLSSPSAIRSAYSPPSRTASSRRSAERSTRRTVGSSRT